MSQITNDVFRPNMESFNISDLMDEIKVMFEEHAQIVSTKMSVHDVSAQHNTVQCDLLKGDHMRLQQILINLIKNSIKFTK